MKFEYDRSLTRTEALENLTRIWEPHPNSETVPLFEAFGRVTAEEIRALHSLPVVRSSRCDGIAVRSSDFVSGTPDTSLWERGVDYAQADTGDDFPDAFDAVIARENISYDDEGRLRIVNDQLRLEPGTSINPSGAIVEKDALIAAAHTVLSPELVAAMAVGGHTQAAVFARPCVAFIPTGSELVAVGEPLSRGQNVEVNSLLVTGMLREWEAEALCYPIVPDDPEKLEIALGRALAEADMVLINGGSSRGEEDFNSRLLERRGTYFRHGVRAMPGRPVGMAIIEDKPVINIPGPVLAAFLCMDWLVRGLVAHYYGIRASKRPAVRARLSCSVKKPAPFERILRVSLSQDEQTCLLCTPLDVNGVVENVRAADGMIALPIGFDEVAAGTEVEVALLRRELMSAQGGVHVN